MPNKPPVKGLTPKKGPKRPRNGPKVSTAAAIVTSAGANVTTERPEGLTDREWSFCLEYLVDLNGRQAAIRAGYAPASASQEASRLRAKVNIAEAISGLLERRAGVTKPGLINELARIGFSDIRKAVTWRPDVEVVEGDDDEEPMKIIRSRVTVVDSALIDDDTAAAIAAVSQGANGVLRVQMHNKVDALEKLARALNLYKEPSPVNVELRPTIILTGRPDTPAAS
jgi:phage terminase small subunit